MNQCLGPCVNEVSEEEYKKITKQITQFIQGDTKEIIDDLQDKMMQASETLNFELAKEYRDLIHYIHHVTSKQHVQFSDQIDRDIFGYYQDKGYLSLQLFFMRNGKLLSKRFKSCPFTRCQMNKLRNLLLVFIKKIRILKKFYYQRILDTTLLEEIVRM